MGDPALFNCLYEICCNAARAERALARYYVEYCQLDPASAARVAKQMREDFDLAPKGMITPLMQYAAQLALGAPYKAPDEKGE